MSDIKNHQVIISMIKQAKNSILASSGKARVSATIEEEINKIIDVACMLKSIENDKLEEGKS